MSNEVRYEGILFEIYPPNTTRHDGAAPQFEKLRPDSAAMDSVDLPEPENRVAGPGLAGNGIPEDAEMRLAEIRTAAEPVRAWTEHVSSSEYPYALEVLLAAIGDPEKE